MATLTSFFLATFFIYIGAWTSGDIHGNFTFLLFYVTGITGLYWLGERLYFLPRRHRAAEALDVALAERQTRLAQQGIQRVDHIDPHACERLAARPWWLDWTAGLFPVIFTVFLLHSFLFAPLKNPSDSMNPVLQPSDLILINKFTYGLRLPVLHTKITSGRSPARGDVLVFRYPPDLNLDHVNRVVGLPGDQVAYLNKRLTINGRAVRKDPMPEYFDQAGMQYFKQYSEKLGDKQYQLLNNDSRSAGVPEAQIIAFAEQKNCRYSVEGVDCKVPEGQYFMMGDNRDNSLDSRYWGFVPDKNIVGQAFFVWMNLDSLARIGPVQ